MCREIISAVRDTLHSRYEMSGLETNKDNFETPKLLLQKLLSRIKSSHLQEELIKYNKNP